MAVTMDMDQQRLIAALQLWLQKQLPDRVGLQVVTVSLPDNGASNITGIIELAWRVDETQKRDILILRTVSLKGVQLYEHYDLKKQYQIMACLAATQINVPRLLGYEADTSFIGREFYVMFNTGGRSISENPPYHLGGWFSEVSADEHHSVWTQGVEAIANIHCLDWQSLGLGFLSDAKNNAEINARFIAHHSGLLSWMERRNNIAYPRLRKVFDWLEANFPQDTHTGLVWGDAKLGNLMIEGDQVVGVLDWEHCTLGPQLYDLANWMIFDRQLSEGMGVPRLAGLPERAETIACWERTTGLNAKDIAYFELFSSVRLTNVVCGMAPELIASGLVGADFGENNVAITVLNNQLASMGLSL